jgi:hypothetical protein
MNNLKKFNNMKYQLKNRINSTFKNYLPYLYLRNSIYINDNKLKYIQNTLLYYLPKTKIITNKVYNITEKKSQRMGKGKGKISYLSTHYYGNKPLFFKKNINYNNKNTLLYLKYSFINICKRYNIFDFK